MRKAEFFLCDLDQMRRQNDAAGMTAPVTGIQRRVVGGGRCIAAVPEDRLDEIKVADQRTRSEETRFE